MSTGRRESRVLKLLRGASNKIAWGRRESAQVLVTQEEMQPMNRGTDVHQYDGIRRKTIRPDDESAFQLKNFHLFPVERIVVHYKSSLTHGLSDEDVEMRLERNGRNIMTPPEDLPFWAKFTLSLFSGLNILLWLTVLFMFISWKPLGHAPDNRYNLIIAIILIFVILISAGLNYYQEASVNGRLEVFRDLSEMPCSVIRSGQVVTVQASELVVGDLVQLHGSMQVPADIRISESNGLKVDRSMLNGDSDPAIIDPLPAPQSASFTDALNIAHMGSRVLEGEGKGIVIASGNQNELSTIVSKMSGANDVTSLQEEVNYMAWIIGCIATVVAFICVMVWIGKIHGYHKQFMDASGVVENMITIFIALIPEGFPITVSIGLIFLGRKMKDKHHIDVRRLSTIETLGSITFVAADKTGTLTQNQMIVTGQVNSSTVAEAEAKKAGNKALNKVDFVKGQKKLEHRSFLIAAHCNQANVLRKPPPENHNKVDEEKGQEPQAIREATGGNATDRALLSWTFSAPDFEKLKDSHDIMIPIPFTPQSRFSAVLVRERKFKDVYVFAKGAPEKILEMCGKFYDHQGEEKAKTPEFTEKVLEMIHKEASLGRHMIALAEIGPLSKHGFSYNFNYSATPTPNFPLVGLTFVTCVALSDPPKTKVKDSITQIRNAGVPVCMITGDAAFTAVSIAKDVGIITAPTTVHQLSDFYRLNSANYRHKMSSATVPLFTKPPPSDSIVVTGTDLEIIDPPAWDYVFGHPEMVFARTTPEQKLSIVLEAQNRGHRVAMMGDGVNDGPALKIADVGIAMSNGTEAVKDAASMVLMTDDFSSIVSGIREGRLFFENLRRVLAYQLSLGCFGQLVPVLATFFFGLPTPLTTFLMIIMSCVSDVFGGVALLLEPEEDAVMFSAPRDLKKRPLFDHTLINYGMVVATISSLGTFYTYFRYMDERGPHNVPFPIPADDGGAFSFPSGYSPKQLVGAWNWGASGGPLGEDEAKAAATASTVFYLCLVFAQMAHILSIRTKLPYFYDAIMNIDVTQDTSKDQPEMYDRPTSLRVIDAIQKSEFRWPILSAWIATICSIFFFNYIVIFRDYLQTDMVHGRYWGMAIGWALLWFVLLEGRKWIIDLFPESWPAIHDW